MEIDADTWNVPVNPLAPNELALMRMLVMRNTRDTAALVGGRIGTPKNVTWLETATPANTLAVAVWVAGGLNITYSPLRVSCTAYSGQPPLPAPMIDAA